MVSCLVGSSCGPGRTHVCQCNLGQETTLATSAKAHWVVDFETGIPYYIPSSLFFSLIAGLHMKKENSLRSEIERGQEANKRFYSTTYAKMWIRFACLTWAWYLERSNMKHPSYHLVYI